MGNQAKKSHLITLTRAQLSQMIIKEKRKALRSFEIFATQNGFSGLSELRKMMEEFFDNFDINYQQGELGPAIHDHVIEGIAEDTMAEYGD